MNRLDEIDIFINSEIEDTFDKIAEHYKNELDGYTYIEELKDFAVLPLKGSLRYINKFSKKLCFGGLLIKIYEKNGNYFASVKNIRGNIYHISYNNNFIFYMKNSNEVFRDSLTCFISDYEKELYQS